jgi:uncharacterized membrane protein
MSMVATRVVLAGIMFWALLASNYIIGIVAALLAVITGIILKRKTIEVTRDERSTLLFEKAAGATIRLCVPLAAFAGIVLIVFEDRLAFGLANPGRMLAYAACVMMLVPLAFHTYYSHKY